VCVGILFAYHPCLVQHAVAVAVAVVVAVADADAGGGWACSEKSVQRGQATCPNSSALHRALVP
jgi:Na+/H+-translocating membrane pyrophosphatase